SVVEELRWRAARPRLGAQQAERLRRRTARSDRRLHQGQPHRGDQDVRRRSHPDRDHDHAARAVRWNAGLRRVMTEQEGAEPEAIDSVAEPKARRWLIARDESGLAVVWLSLFLMVLIGFAALAVDLGHGYFV